MRVKNRHGVFEVGVRAFAGVPDGTSAAAARDAAMAASAAGVYEVSLRIVRQPPHGAAVEPLWRFFDQALPVVIGAHFKPSLRVVERYGRKETAYFLAGDQLIIARKVDGGPWPVIEVVSENVLWPADDVLARRAWWMAVFARFYRRYVRNGQSGVVFLRTGVFVPEDEIAEWRTAWLEWAALNQFSAHHHEEPVAWGHYRRLALVTPVRVVAGYFREVPGDEWESPWTLPSSRPVKATDGAQIIEADERVRLLPAGGETLAEFEAAGQVFRLSFHVVKRFRERYHRQNHTHLSWTQAVRGIVALFRAAHEVRRKNYVSALIEHGTDARYFYHSDQWVFVVVESTISTIYEKDLRYSPFYKPSAC